MDTVFIIVIFSTAFILTMFLAAGLNVCLDHLFGIRIFPKGFFDTDKETWKKW